MKNRFFSFLMLALFLLPLASIMAQQVPQIPAVPMDPKIRYGKLDNGMTYYIRANQQPKERAEFYIAQNVGAILEEDNQNGLAHFLEHMAFNGTKNFPGKGILNYLEKQGVKFGYNINAYTSLDETVYNLSDVPTYREGIVDSALLVLHDWSSFILLEEDEIDSERGVIREEWRSGAHAERRLWKESNKLKYPGSQYAKRDVIGDTAVINNFKYSELRDFYHKWYRPDLQAILIVGDIDVDKVEAKIKKMFSDIPAKANAGERPVYEIPDNNEPIIAVVKDKEARFTRINLEYKKDPMPAEVKLSMGGYGFMIVNQLISQMINDRFEEIAMDPNAALIAGFAQYGSLVKSKDAFFMIGIPQEGKELTGLEALALEAEKIRRFGFTNSEFERAKTNLLKNYEKSYNERENIKNNSLVREYVRHYLEDEPVPGIEWEYQTVQMLLPNFPLEAINQMAQSYVTDENLIVSITAPEKETVKLPSDTQILAALASAKTADLVAKEEEKFEQPLIEKEPKAGTLKKETVNSIVGTIEWELSNGVKVVFKTTDFKKDEILLNAFSQGGLSKVKVEDLASANFATDIVSSNGLGNFNQVDLRKVLTGKIANVNPFIGEYEEGFSGNSSVTDFETMLQLVYLNFTAPRKDDNAYQALMNMVRTSFANLDSNPRVAFSDSINATLSNHSKRTLSTNLALLDKVNQDKALAIFKERFANAADFTFVFTGNADPSDPKVREAVLTYLGGLKTNKKKETFTDNNVRKPKGEVKNYFTKKMETHNASNFVVISAPMEYNAFNRTTMRAIGDILTLRYTESIREKEGGSYGVGCAGRLSNTPVNEANLFVQFDCAPDRQEHLMSIVFDEINEIVNNGPRAEDLAKVKENLLKQYAEDIEENSWWNSSLKLFYADNINLPADYKVAIENLSAPLIHKTLRDLVTRKNSIQVVMLPAE